jgi:hypothetical protein
MDPQVQEYVDRIESLHRQMEEVFQGLDSAALNWKPLKQGANSMAVLAHHAAGSERYWVCQVVGGQDIQRDRDAEFVTQASTPAHLKAALDRAAQDVRRTLAGYTAPDLRAQHDVRGAPRSAHWCLAQVIEHLAMHAGHMQLTRQLYEAQAGRPYTPPGR